jgi:hypothetical protein
MRVAGQILRLTADIIAVAPYENGVRGVVIPTGNTVRVVKNPSPADSRMADVLWADRPVVVLRRDLRGAKQIRQATR